MKRDTAREIAVQILFGKKFGDFSVKDFLSDENLHSLTDECDIYAESPGRQEKYIKSVINLFNEHSEEIDECIRANLSGWDIRRISGTALAALRCAVTEMLYIEDIPVSASINSAVEIDKKYDDENTVSFVNGVLGGIARGLQKD